MKKVLFIILTSFFLAGLITVCTNVEPSDEDDDNIPVEEDTILTIQEGAAGECGCKGIVEDDQGGYTEDGYINGDNGAGNYMMWNVDASSTVTAVPCSLVWRYAYGGSQNGKNGKLVVNGEVVQEVVTFDYTESWSNWETTAPVNVFLQAGENNIRLESIQDGGLANIDYIQITGVGISPGGCNVLYYTLDVTADPTLYYYT